jgi:predicted transcriptional regulator
MSTTIFPDDTARVRKSSPVTSHEAADSNNVSRSHKFLVKALTLWGPLAQFEAENLLRGVLSPSRIRSAFSELEALGKVKRTDQFRLTPSGRRAQVWSLA